MIPVSDAPGSLSAWLFWGGFSGIPPLRPNPRRTIRPVVTGYARRAFLKATPITADVFTFDLSVLLGGQTITAVVAYVFEMANPTAQPNDAAASSRVLAGPSIDDSGTQVSVRIGGFPDAAINYRLGPIVRDSQGNVFDSFSILPVDPRTDPAWLS